MARILVINAHRHYRVRKRPLERYVRRVLQQQGAGRAEIRVVCIDSHYATSLNKRYLGHNRATDVLSFPLERGGRLEGEVYVNLDRVRLQAREYGVRFGNELARVVIHGTLHLVGYDDQRERDARRMLTAEEAHLRFWFPT